MCLHLFYFFLSNNCNKQKKKKKLTLNKKNTYQVYIIGCNDIIYKHINDIIIDCIPNIDYDLFEFVFLCFRYHI